MGYRASEKLKGALIGSGFFSRNHLHAWRDIEGTEIVALCDTDSERLNLTAAEFVIERAYSDAAEMIATERLDFVDTRQRCVVTGPWSRWQRAPVSR